MKILDFIVCDDIRREIGDKLSLMGIYNDEILFTGVAVTWPQALRMGIYVRFVVEQRDPLPDEMTMQIRMQDAVVFQATGDTAGIQQERAVSTQLVAMVPIVGPGELLFRFILSAHGEQLPVAERRIAVDIASG